MKFKDLPIGHVFQILEGVPEHTMFVPFVKTADGKARRLKVSHEQFKVEPHWEVTDDELKVSKAEYERRGKNEDK